MTRVSSAPAVVSQRPFPGLLPDSVTRWVKVTAWINLIVNVGIIGTGGLVRLTGSGMGCPTWPTCTADSLIPTDELTGHSIIEFGNRTLTGILVIAALLAFLAVIRITERPELRKLTFTIGLGVILQAIIGGITVWMHLHPSIVGVHYFISTGLVVIATVALCRVYGPSRPLRLAAPRWFTILAVITSIAVVVTVVVGILLTGAGPHAGDAAAARNGLDPAFWQHVHSWPAYVTLALTLALVAGAFRMPRDLGLIRWTTLLLVVELVQIVIGVWQARAGLPIVLVNIHMVLAALLVAAMTAVLANLWRGHVAQLGHS